LLTAYLFSASTSSKDLLLFVSLSVFRHPEAQPHKPITKQIHLLAIVESHHLSLFGYTARMPDTADARTILTTTGGNHQVQRGSRLHSKTWTSPWTNWPLWRLLSCFALCTHRGARQKI